SSDRYWRILENTVITTQISPAGDLLCGGTIGSNGGRIVSVDGSGPSIAAYSASGPYGGGFWIGGTGAIQFGQTDSAGAPLATHGYLSGATLGFATTGDISIANSNGATALCYGNG